MHCEILTLAMELCRYQQQCQDLRRSLAALQAERDESATQVAVIRRAFAATFFQRRRRRSSRGTHATSEQVHDQCCSAIAKLTKWLLPFTIFLEYSTLFNNL